MDQAGLTDTSGDVTSSSENSSQVRGSQCEVSGPAAATALGKLGWEWTGVMTIIVRFYSVSRGARQHHPQTCMGLCLDQSLRGPLLSLR